MLRILCLIYFFTIDATIASLAMDEPDFDSNWTMIGAGSGASNPSFLVFAHNLTEMPILVDVQVKSVDAPNMDFIFPGVGVCIRDDDDPELFGDVCYLYNEIDIRVATPKVRNEHDTGMVIYAANGTYFSGPNNQASRDALVRVRAWIQSSLPTPDFSTSGISVVAQSPNEIDVYREVHHGLMEYPSLVLVRVKLGDGLYAGYMSDALGSTPVVQTIRPRYNYNGVAFGFDNQTVRVWIPSVTKTRTFIWTAKDGHAFVGDTEALTGELEIYAWRYNSLTPALVQTATLGIDVLDENFTVPHTYPGLNHFFIQIWAQATDGPNNGFRFRGSGAAGFDTDPEQDPVCTYGGLTYAYNSDEFRFWRPTNASNGGIICIATASGLGINNQSSISADVIMHTWIFNTTYKYLYIEQEDVEESCWF